MEIQEAMLETQNRGDEGRQKNKAPSYFSYFPYRENWLIDGVWAGEGEAYVSEGYEAYRRGLQCETQVKFLGTQRKQKLPLAEETLLI